MKENSKVTDTNVGDIEKNSIEELKQRIEELYRIQQSRLDVGADDLDIREEIAEVEEEIKELQDNANVDRKNSIEEDIECIQEFLEYSQNMINDMDYERPVDVTIYQNETNAIEHILSDYKRVLKENEEWQRAYQEEKDRQFDLIKENEKLRCENGKLRTIKYDTAYGVESIYLITKRNLVEINTNKYFIEIQDGKFVDLKQVYQENERLKKQNQCYINLIEKEIKYHERNILDIENITMLKRKSAKEEAEIEFNKYAIVVLNKILQELIEGRK